MPNADASRIAFVALELSSVSLLSLLLATQFLYKIRRHPVVLALLVGDLLRSLVGVFPGLLVQSMRQWVNGIVNDTVVARFCATEGFLLGYFLTVKIAFGVSFAVCVLVMARHVESPEEVAPGLARSTSIVLAVAPYVWALPILLVPVAALARNGWKQPTAAFEGFICVLHDQALFVLAGFMLWIPLAISLLLSVAVTFYISRFYHRHHGILSFRQMPDFSPMLRFGAMTAIIVTTTVFFALINASLRPEPALIHTASRFWQAISTLLQFCIFTQAQVLRVWKGWVYGLLGHRTAPSEIPAPPRQTESLRRPEDSPWTVDSLPPRAPTPRLRNGSGLRRIWRSMSTPSVLEHNSMSHARQKPDRHSLDSLRLGVRLGHSVPSSPSDDLQDMIMLRELSLPSHIPSYESFPARIKGHGGSVMDL